MFMLRTTSEAPLTKLMPLVPGEPELPSPSRSRPSSTTLAPAALIVMAGPPDAVMPASGLPSQRSVIDLVIVTWPKPPGSRQLISPPVAVLEMAPAKVLHGAVRLHGLTSSPTPEI